jgi:hypothetical protein
MGKSWIFEKTQITASWIQYVSGTVHVDAQMMTSAVSTIESSCKYSTFSEAAKGMDEAVMGYKNIFGKKGESNYCRRA